MRFKRFFTILVRMDVPVCFHWPIGHFFHLIDIVSKLIFNFKLTQTRNCTKSLLSSKQEQKINSFLRISPTYHSGRSVVDDLGLAPAVPVAEELERLDAILEGGRALAQRDGRLDGGGRREGHLYLAPSWQDRKRHAFASSDDAGHHWNEGRV